MQINDPVMVPRTGGYYSVGEIIELYTDSARVQFEIGHSLHGKPVPPGMQGAEGYKTVKISELLPLVKIWKE